jgi:DNA-binding MarR family transcriptional regulator
MKHIKEKLMGDTVRSFRSHLREIERQVAWNLKDQTTCCGVSMAQCHLLLAMAELENPSIAELAGRMLLDASTLSRTVDGLVKAGLLTRVEDPDNRRRALLSFTDKGRQTCDVINRGCDEFYARMLARIPAKGHASFLRAVATLAMMLRTEIPFAGCDGASTQENSHG